MAAGMALSVNEAVDEAGLGRGEIWQGEDREGGRADAQAGVLRQGGNGEKSIGFGKMIESLEGEVGFSQDEVADKYWNSGGELVFEELGGSLEEALRFLREKPHDD